MGVPGYQGASLQIGLEFFHLVLLPFLKAWSPWCPITSQQTGKEGVSRTKLNCSHSTGENSYRPHKGKRGWEIWSVAGHQFPSENCVLWKQRRFLMASQPFCTHRLSSGSFKYNVVQLLRSSLPTVTDKNFPISHSAYASYRYSLKIKKCEEVITHLGNSH